MQDGANDAFTGQEQEQQKPRYTIVCDFHDTLSKGGEIDTSLLRALLIELMLVCKLLKSLHQE